jgi:hypothetical protein
VKTWLAKIIFVGEIKMHNINMKENFAAYADEKFAVAFDLAENVNFGRLLLLLMGALGYGLLEIFWRGWTHWSMLLAGGICFFGINFLDERLPGITDGRKSLLCGLMITAVELIFGFLFNFVLGANIWDYSALPYNFHGQICLYYSLIWCVLAYFLLKLVRILRLGL